MVASRPYDRADDKERGIGLLAAPISGAIGVLVTSTLISNDPPKPSPHHVAVAVYHELLIVMMLLALAMLGMALLRRRLLLGVAIALFGLTLFNMHYWGFGIPYLIAGSWYIVRAFRMQREWREANGDVSRPASGPPTGRSGPGSARPGASGRYTPPSAGRRRRRR